MVRQRAAPVVVAHLALRSADRERAPDVVPESDRQNGERLRFPGSRQSVAPMKRQGCHRLSLEGLALRAYRFQTRLDAVAAAVDGASMAAEAVARDSRRSS